MSECSKCDGIAGVDWDGAGARRIVELEAEVERLRKEPQWKFEAQHHRAACDKYAARRDAALKILDSLGEILDPRIEATKRALIGRLDE